MNFHPQRICYSHQGVWETNRFVLHPLVKKLALWGLKLNLPGQVCLSRCCFVVSVNNYGSIQLIYCSEIKPDDLNSQRKPQQRSPVKRFNLKEKRSSKFSQARLNNLFASENNNKFTAWLCILKFIRKASFTDLCLIIVFVRFVPHHNISIQFLKVAIVGIKCIKNYNS